MSHLLIRAPPLPHPKANWILTTKPASHPGRDGTPSWRLKTSSASFAHYPSLHFGVRVLSCWHSALHPLSGYSVAVDWFFSCLSSEKWISRTRWKWPLPIIVLADTWAREMAFGQRHVVLRYESKAHDFLGRVCWNLPLQKGQVAGTQPNAAWKRGSVLVSQARLTRTRQTDGLGSACEMLVQISDE